MESSGITNSVILYLHYPKGKKTLRSFCYSLRRNKETSQPLLRLVIMIKKLFQLFTQLIIHDTKQSTQYFKITSIIYLNYIRIVLLLIVRLNNCWFSYPSMDRRT